MIDPSDPVENDTPFQLEVCHRCSHTRRRHHPGALVNADQGAIHRACAISDCPCDEFSRAEQPAVVSVPEPLHDAVLAAANASFGYVMAQIGIPIGKVGELVVDFDRVIREHMAKNAGGAS